MSQLLTRKYGRTTDANWVRRAHIEKWFHDRAFANFVNQKKTDAALFLRVGSDPDTVIEDEGWGFDDNGRIYFTYYRHTPTETVRESMTWLATDEWLHAVRVPPPDHVI